MLIPKERILRQILLFAAFALFEAHALRAQNTTGAPITINVGDINAPFVSSLVIDDQSLGNNAFVYNWHYSATTESDGVSPLTGDDLVNAIVAGTVGTQYALNPITEGNGGVDAGVVGFQIGTKLSFQVSPYDSSAISYWYYWITGGNQTASYPPFQSISPTNWTPALDTAFDRTLSNGSLDGWTLSAYDANYNPTGGAPLSAASSVPEPSTLPLALFSLPVLIAIAGWKRFSKTCLC